MGSVNVFAGGAWRSAKNVFVFSGGVWKPANSIMTKVDGRWRRLYFPVLHTLTVGSAVVNTNPKSTEVGFRDSKYTRFGTLTPRALANGVELVGLTGSTARPDVACLDAGMNFTHAKYNIKIDGYGSLDFENNGGLTLVPAPNFYNWMMSKKGQNIDLVITVTPL